MTGDQSALDTVRAHWNGRATSYDAFYQRYPESKRDSWRAAYKAILGQLEPGRIGPLRVLDVGTGSGFLAILLAELGHDVTAVDPACEMLGHARRAADRRAVRVEWRELGAHDTAELGTTFDLVTARYVLWTLPNPVAALTAWRRTLRPGGILLLADGVWRSRRMIGRSLLSAAVPGADREPLRALARDYRQFHRATPRWRGLTTTRAQSLLRRAGFASSERLEHLLAEDAHPQCASFSLLACRSTLH